MVTTRSNVASKPSKHIKFDKMKDEQVVSALAGMLNEEGEEQDEAKDSSTSPNVSEEIEDSDEDDAPEEESLSAAKAAIIEEKRKADAAVAKEKLSQREKRRQLAEHNKLQQQAKREKQEQAQASSTNENLPDFLPDELLQELDSNASKEPAPNTHLRVRELDERDQREIKQRLIEEKLAKIKSLKSNAVRKGPINVKVQKFGERQKAVPRAESKIINSRDQWLQRKSLKRK